MHDDGVTVVIPTMNRWDRLRGTLAMVLNQQACGPFEVVVVDDGGSDGTSERVRAIADPRLRVVRLPRPGGVSAARNAGLAQVRTRWVAFTDDDDLWAPDKLALQLAAVRAVEGEPWSAGAAVTVFDDWSVLRVDDPPPACDVARLALADNPIPGGGSGVLAATELVRRVGGFDPALSLLADWDLWIRLALSATFVPVEQIVLAYVRHDGAMSNRVAAFTHETAAIRARYAPERQRLGVEHFGVNVRRWLADALAREGRRASALRLYVPLAVETRRRELAWSIAAASLGPELRARLPLHRRPSGAPPARAEVFAAELRTTFDAVQATVPFGTVPGVTVPGVTDVVSESVDRSADDGRGRRRSGPAMATPRA